MWFRMERDGSLISPRDYGLVAMIHLHKTVQNPPSWPRTGTHFDKLSAFFYLLGEAGLGDGWALWRSIFYIPFIAFDVSKKSWLGKPTATVLLGEN